VGSIVTVDSEVGIGVGVDCIDVSGGVASGEVAGASHPAVNEEIIVTLIIVNNILLFILPSLLYLHVI